MNCPICGKPYSSFEQYDPHDCLSKMDMKKRIEELESERTVLKKRIGELGIEGTATTLPAVIEPEIIEPTAMDLRADLPVGIITGDIDQALLLVAYKAGINRGHRGGFDKGKKLGLMISGSADASYREGYDQCYADLEKLGRLK